MKILNKLIEEVSDERKSVFYSEPTGEGKVTAEDVGLYLLKGTKYTDKLNQYFTNWFYQDNDADFVIEGDSSHGRYKITITDANEGEYNLMFTINTGTRNTRFLVKTDGTKDKNTQVQNVEGLLLNYAHILENESDGFGESFYNFSFFNDVKALKDR